MIYLIRKDILILNIFIRYVKLKGLKSECDFYVSEDLFVNISITCTKLKKLKNLRKKGDFIPPPLTHQCSRHDNRAEK